MNQIANFSVDPRLASILGENYTSSERALRELVDNAWDAEARVVRITLPDILTEAPIIV
jgi:DNA mismatch repair ATPase MutL